MNKEIKVNQHFICKTHTHSHTHENRCDLGNLSGPKIKQISIKPIECRESEDKDLSFNEYIVTGNHHHDIFFQQISLSV